MKSVDTFRIIDELNNQINALKTELFTGVLSLTIDNSVTCKIFFRIGRISWLSEGLNYCEKWQRHLKYFCFNLKPEELQKFLDLKDSKEQYQALVYLQGKGLISRKQLDKFITNIVIESLFDVLLESYARNKNITYKSVSDNNQGAIIHLIDSLNILLEVKSLFTRWIESNLQKYSPNSYPVIKQPELLTKNKNIKIPHNILSLINGTVNLRSIAWKTNKNIVEITESVVPLVESGAITLSSLATPPKTRKFQNAALKNRNKYLIACVDDSLLLCQNLESIITKAGYNFVGIQEPLQALTLLLKNKPDFIFLDLIMPIINGYELCGQLKKTPTLQHTPIVILTGKDGLVDRMRAKMIGSTDFLAKPIEETMVLNMIHKHINTRR